jgi:D-xylose transport system permease protein
MATAETSLAGRTVRRRSLLAAIRPFSTLLALGLIWLISHYVLSEKLFLGARNLTNLMAQMSILGIAATGMFMVIVTGQIDLSVGSVAVLCATTAGLLYVVGGLDPYLSMVIAVGLGALIGAVQGFAIAYLKVPAFMVTLAGLLLWRGVHLVMTDGMSVPSLGPAFEMIGAQYIPPNLARLMLGIASGLYVLLVVVKTIRRKRRGVTAETRRALVSIVGALVVAVVLVFHVLPFRGLPTPMAIMFLIFLIVNFITLNTRFGRHLFAVGGNREMAVLAGIDVDRLNLKVFTLAGAIYAIAGLVLAGRLGSASPNMGQNLELEAIASCVIGGTSLMGGEGTVLGAMMGALVMASLDNGLALNWQLSPYWKFIVKGWILVAAVWFDTAAKRIRK